MQTDFPEPVVPAIKRCGIEAKSPTIGAPEIFFPSAIGNLISNGYTKIKEVVVIGSGDLLCSPCGGCRQRLREFASLDINIHMCNINGHIKTSTLDELLPDSFGPENL